SSARRAEAIHSGRSNTRPACAKPRMASAFQDTSTFSSRPGRTRFSRVANSFARPASTSASFSVGRATRRSQCLFSEFGAEQRPVVVQHLLEVRYRPFRVYAVAAKAAAQLVVDAALAHALERQERDVLLALAQAKLEVRWMWKLRRAAEAAADAVKVGAQVI